MEDPSTSSAAPSQEACRNHQSEASYWSTSETHHTNCESTQYDRPLLCCMLRVWYSESQIFCRHYVLGLAGTCEKAYTSIECCGVNSQKGQPFFQCICSAREKVCTRTTVRYWRCATGAIQGSNPEKLTSSITGTTIQTCSLLSIYCWVQVIDHIVTKQRRAFCCCECGVVRFHDVAFPTNSAWHCWRLQRGFAVFKKYSKQDGNNSKCMV